MTELLIRGQLDAAKGISSVNKLPDSLKSRAAILHVLKKASLYDTIYYTAIAIVGVITIALAYSEWMTYLTVAELISGLVVANLIARGKILGLWINILDCILYGIIAFLSHAYGEMVKVFVISNIFNVYGLINWSKASKETATADEFDVRVLSKKMIAFLAPLYVALTIGTFFVLKAFNTNKVYLGSILFTSNILIKFLQMSRYREAWYVSLAADGLNVTMWTMILIDNLMASGDWSILPTVACSIGYFSSSVNGLIVWNKLYKKSQRTGSIYLAMRPMYKITKFVPLKRKYAHLVWKKETDHVPTPEEIAISRRMRVSFRRGMFSGS